VKEGPFEFGNQVLISTPQAAVVKAMVVTLLKWRRDNSGPGTVRERRAQGTAAELFESGFGDANLGMTLPPDEARG